MKRFKLYFVILVVFALLALIFLNSLEFKNFKEKSEVKIVPKETSVIVEKVQCGRFPQKQHITVDNIIWQHLKIAKGFYKLMNAYLDERENRTIVRVSMIGDRLNVETDAIYCQFWFDELPEAQPIVVRATQFFMMWPECNVHDLSLYVL
jgi:hypothetical protein